MFQLYQLLSKREVFVFIYTCSVCYTIVRINDSLKNVLATMKIIDEERKPLCATTKWDAFCCPEVNLKSNSEKKYMTESISQAGSH